MEVLLALVLHALARDAHASDPARHRTRVELLTVDAVLESTERPAHELLASLPLSEMSEHDQLLVGTVKVLVHDSQGTSALQLERLSATLRVLLQEIIKDAAVADPTCAEVIAAPAAPPQAVPYPPA